MSRTPGVGEKQLTLDHAIALTLASLRADWPLHDGGPARRSSGRRSPNRRRLMPPASRNGRSSTSSTQRNTRICLHVRRRARGPAAGQSMQCAGIGSLPGAAHHADGKGRKKAMHKSSLCSNDQEESHDAEEL